MPLITKIPHQVLATGIDVSESTAKFGQLGQDKLIRITSDKTSYSSLIKCREKRFTIETAESSKEGYKPGFIVEFESQDACCCAVRFGKQGSDGAMMVGELDNMHVETTAGSEYSSILRLERYFSPLEQLGTLLDVLIGGAARDLGILSDMLIGGGAVRDLRYLRSSTISETTNHVRALEALSTVRLAVDKALKLVLVEKEREKVEEFLRKQQEDRLSGHYGANE